MGIRFQFEGLGLEEGLGGAQWELRRITPGDTLGCACLDAALPVNSIGEIVGGNFWTVSDHFM